MKTSVTLGFTGLFVLVAVCYYFFGMPLSKPAAPLVVSGDGKLLPFDAESSLRLIQIQNLLKKETITLEYGEDRWFVRHPAEYPADKMMAEGLVSALKVSTKSRRLMRERGWDEYGLSRPDIKIGVEAQGDSHRRYLLLGDASPVTNMVYARWDHEDEYFLLDARMKQAFDRTLYSLREKKIVRLPVQSVDRIHVQTFKGNYEISRQEGKWYWTEPVARIGKKITDEKVYQLLLLLNELHIKEFLDGKSPEDGDYGFLRAAPFMQLWAKDQTSTLRIGREVVEREAYYGVIEGEKTLLLVSKELMDSFFKIFDRVTEEPEAAEDPVPAPEEVPDTQPSAEKAETADVLPEAAETKDEPISLLKV